MKKLLVSLLALSVVGLGSVANAGTIGDALQNAANNVNKHEQAVTQAQKDAQARQAANRKALEKKQQELKKKHEQAKKDAEKAQKERQQALEKKKQELKKKHEQRCLEYFNWKISSNISVTNLAELYFIMFRYVLPECFVYDKMIVIWGL